MTSLYVDITLCIMTYLFLIGFIFWRRRKNNNNGDSSSDGDGGLPVENGPKLDLPPGVCLPGDGPSILKKEQLEDSFA